MKFWLKTAILNSVEKLAKFNCFDELRIEIADCIYTQLPIQEHFPNIVINL